tara:strand:+ start:420 stop:758 length:339 start_codon:yes stop_codon:yes gene_type:complete
MDSKLDVNDIFKRIQGLAKFARSVLHLPFPDLEQVNPSFGVISATCELLSVILRDEAHSGREHADDLAVIMNDIAVAIVNRDDTSLIDSMAILDEFTDRLTTSMPSLVVVKK